MGPLMTTWTDSGRTWAVDWTWLFGRGWSDVVGSFATWSDLSQKSAWCVSSVWRTRFPIPFRFSISSVTPPETDDFIWSVNFWPKSRNFPFSINRTKISSKQTRIDRDTGTARTSLTNPDWSQGVLVTGKRWRHNTINENPRYSSYCSSWTFCWSGAQFSFMIVFCLL